jgi:hypothetical protein
MDDDDDDIVGGAKRMTRDRTVRAERTERRGTSRRMGLVLGLGLGFAPGVLLGAAPAAAPRLPEAQRGRTHHLCV